MARSSQVTAWVGWVWFAGVVLLVLGLFNAISGLVAAFSPEKLVGLGEQGIVVLDVSTWGWVHLVVGILLVIVGFSVRSRWWPPAATHKARARSTCRCCDLQRAAAKAHTGCRRCPTPQPCCRRPWRTACRPLRRAAPAC